MKDSLANLYLNTSNVMVHPISSKYSSLISLDLNTSNVMVHPFSALYFLPYFLFKYI